jgi:DNA modification methylase
MISMGENGRYTVQTRVIHDDCLHLPNHVQQPIQLLFTSTPYPGLRGFPLSAKEYVTWWVDRLRAMLPLLTETAVIGQVINFPRIDGRFPTHLFMLPHQVAEALDLFPINVYIWDKLNAPPAGNSRARYDRNEWEMVLLFGKTENYLFNPVRRPYKPKSRRKDGQAKHRKADIAGKLTKGHLTLHPDGARQSNVIRLSSSGCQGRPRVKGGSFPRALPRRFILQHTNPGDWILDPCCGAGTTLIEAARHGRHAIGCDTDLTAVRTARDWLQSEQQPG